MKIAENIKKGKKSKYKILVELRFDFGMIFQYVYVFKLIFNLMSILSSHLF